MDLPRVGVCTAALDFDECSGMRFSREGSVIEKQKGSPGGNKSNREISILHFNTSITKEDYYV
jgi:hypothetical protein